MTITAEALKVARNDDRRVRLETARKLENTLIAGSAGNDQLVELIDELRTMPAPPKSAGPRNRKVTRTVAAFELRFHAKSAGAFVNDNAMIVKRKVSQSAQRFAFEGDVTVTRERHGSGFYWSLSDGVRWVSVGESKTPEGQRSFWLMRSGGFARRSGRGAMSGRYAGRRPSASSE